MALKLGQLKNLKLKSVWSHEERDFTPWLAEESHLAALSEAIGMDLQLERIEVPVGPYWADILAKDASGDYVVIENQFGKTNHASMPAGGHGRRAGDRLWITLHKWQFQRLQKTEKPTTNLNVRSHKNHNFCWPHYAANR